MKLRITALGVIFLSLALSPARAQTPIPSPASKLPQKPVKTGPVLSTGTVLSYMIHPIKNGMGIYLPVIAADPNSGVTYGVMPIWVIQSPKTERITYIHAPSLTYNQYFGWSPTYRLYYYPTDVSNVVLRGSWDRYEHEAFASYDDQRFLGKNMAASLLFQNNVDASRRFYGLGPTAPLSGQTNYTADYIRAQGSLGIPLGYDDSNWKIYLRNHFIEERTYGGPIAGLPSFQTTYPGEFSPSRQNIDDWRMSLGYDSRDSTVTPSRGSQLQLYSEYSAQALGSGYDYDRYGVKASHLRNWGDKKAGTTAVGFQFEQLLGSDIPFWDLPSLGGKYSLRAYGDGRFVDNGMVAVNAEQRFTVYQAEMAGVKVQGQVAPFIGVGTVFDTVENAQGKYLRPVIGAAVRAIAPPQVVGSIDIGLGQEGAAVFMDVNYSF